MASKATRREGSDPPEQRIGSRRTFFKWATGILSTLMGVGITVPILGYVILPALQRQKRPWMQVGDVETLLADQPQELTYESARKDGWWTTKSKKAVWAIKQSSGSITVFSPICPHLGCGYRWNAGDHHFKCPCHGSVYDITGKVLGGPAPRPLDALPAKVEQGKLWVVYKEFKTGLDHPVEL